MDAEIKAPTSPSGVGQSIALCALPVDRDFCLPNFSHPGSFLFLFCVNFLQNVLTCSFNDEFCFGGDMTFAVDWAQSMNISLYPIHVVVVVSKMCVICSSRRSSRTL